LSLAEILSRIRIPGCVQFPVPDDLEALTIRGEECSPSDLKLSRVHVEAIWESVADLYSTGLYPGIQLTVRRQGRVVLDRAIGHVLPPPTDAPRSESAARLTPNTPFVLYSVSKVMTALLIHKLDEEGQIHMDDRVAEYLPEFATRGKEDMTIRHLLTHRAGIPDFPREATDPAIYGSPLAVTSVLAQQKPVSLPGQYQAYHGVTSGAVLGALIHRVTGHSPRRLLDRVIRKPLGCRWMSYGVARRSQCKVARDILTGFSVKPPISWIFDKALGMPFEDLVERAGTPDFLNGVIPSLNVVATSGEVSRLFQCLLEGGSVGGVQLFDRRTVHRVISDQNRWQFDHTAMVPLRLSGGMVLSGRWLGLFGFDSPRAFGHNGFTNIFAWADPERDLAATILSSGKPLLTPHIALLARFYAAMWVAFPRLTRNDNFRIWQGQATTA